MDLNIYSRFEASADGTDRSFEDFPVKSMQFLRICRKLFARRPITGAFAVLLHIRRKSTPGSDLIESSVFNGFKE